MFHHLVNCRTISRIFTLYLQVVLLNSFVFIQEFFTHNRMDPKLECNLFEELCNAVEKGDAHTVEDFLHERKVNPNSSKPEKKVPLSIAIKAGRVDIIQMLITNEPYPANPNQALTLGTEILENFDHGINPTPFLHAVYSENVDVIKVLLSESIVKVNLEHEGLLLDKGLFTALTLAICLENVSIVELLLQAKADLNHNIYPEFIDSSPINMALNTGNVRICRMLLDAKAHPHNLEKPALMVPENYVAMHGNLEILKLLVKHGALISDKVIQTVVEYRYPDLLEYCLDHEHQRLANVFQWDESKLEYYMRIFVYGTEKQSDERCFAVLLRWGIYTASMPSTQESAFLAAAYVGAIKTMRMMVELRPQCLQERWLAKGEIPLPLAGLGLTTNHIEECRKFAATLIETRKIPCSLMVLCRTKIIQSLGYKPFTKVPELPLPRAHKDFVMLKNVEGF